MKCAGGHEMNGKFCGECGQKPAATEMLKASCSCGHEQESKLNHCTECGERMLKAAEADLDASLGMLSDFAAQAEALRAGLEITPAQPDPDFLKATQPDASGHVDGIAVIQGMMDSQNVSLGHLESIGGAVQASRRDLGTFAKAIHGSFVGLRTVIGSLRQQIEALSDTRRPRRATVVPFQKAGPSVPEGQTGDGDVPTLDTEVDENGKPVGKGLVRAATAAFSKGQLEPSDPVMIQAYVNEGLDLGFLVDADAILKANPPLGARLKAALAAAA